MSELQNVPCYIEGMDDILGGFKSPAAILIAGSAGVGKTTMALQMLANAAKAGEKALYIPLTTETAERFRLSLSTFKFLDDSVEVHEINRANAEKDPLSTLIDIGNVITSVNPDRIVIDPITPIGFGFVEQERRRFFYTLDSMIRESNALTFLIGELEKEEIHKNVASHLTDGIIYLSRSSRESRSYQEMEILKMRGVEPPYSIGCMIQSFNYSVNPENFRVFSDIKANGEIIKGEVISSGIEGFDEMISNKLQSGSSILVAGEPGSGKTVFGLQFINKSLENGDKCVILTFYETVDQIIENAASFGWDFRKHVDSGNLVIVSDGLQDICFAKYSNLIKENIEQSNAKRVMIDGLPNIELSITDPMKLRGFLHSLTNYLKEKGVTSLFTTEMTGAGWEKVNSLEASFIVDILLVLKMTEDADTTKRLLQVMKARGIPSNLTLKEFQIDEKGITLG
ncbi:circadian clock protein KaiC [Methanohalophilus levihalophilus]|uniref:ATPase domain-containing protein n=1 Tax=Methanohalophilus levihalophilus TaxID=1431282 RepID=UPI001AE15400|nr:ATPase domain-containing protein [Methanohalophilus levihalophilus]MBP2030735.1 circadian clock protein KaiC [Methanohalophilus levihalophilus]